MNRRPNTALSIRFPVWRARFVVSLFFLGFISLIARAFYCQGVNHEFLQSEAELRYERTKELVATRGVIRDRNGEPLAISAEAASVFANPSELNLKEIPREKIKELALILGVDYGALSRRLGQTNREFVYLKRQVAPQTAEKVMSLSLPGVALQTEYKRYYPGGDASAHLIGFTSVDHAGQEGLEYSYQDWLAGKPGSLRVIRDRRGQVVEEPATLASVENGKELALSIDRNIQYLAFREAKNTALEHQAKSASIVVLDVQSGEILALANWPSYNPNNRQTYKPEWTRNRAVVDLFEPGSTLKPFTVAAALEDGLITPKTLVDIEDGRLRFGKYTIKDTHPDESLLTVTEIIQKSSNVGSVKIAMMLQAERLRNLLANSGFGRVTGSKFPGEVSGQLRPLSEWKPIDQATASYGMGISVSLLQLARAYTIFATGGKLLPVSLEKARGDIDGERVISERTASQVLTMLEQVTREGGTASAAAIPGYRVAGKTGTAHKLLGGKYAADLYLSSFVGLAPASAPRLIVAVSVDEPKGKKYYGGQVAAPAFKKVMEGALRIMGVMPEVPTETQEVKVVTPPDKV